MRRRLPAPAGDQRLRPRRERPRAGPRDVNWAAIGVGGNDNESRPAGNNWALLDATIDRAVRCRGLNVLANISYTPPWTTQRLRGVVSQPIRARYLPDDLNDWAAFVREAVARYPEVRYWSIWNEPNTTDAFRGWNNGATADLVEDYNRLLDYAVPQIVANPDGQGRRSVVALELAGADYAALAPWVRGVLGGRHKGNVDFVAYHHYGRDYEIRDKLYNLVAEHDGDVGGWRWPVWVTEAGPIGCNDLRQPDGAADLRARGRYEYCTGDSLAFIADDFQGRHVGGVLTYMRQSPAGARWAKTFYWHSHDETIFDPAARGYVGTNYGILAGAKANALRGRPAFTNYAQIAGPLVLSGPTYGYNQRVPVTATPAVSDSYY